MPMPDESSTTTPFNFSQLCAPSSSAYIAATTAIGESFHPSTATSDSLTLAETSFSAPQPTPGTTATQIATTTAASSYFPSSHAPNTSTTASIVSDTKLCLQSCVVLTGVLGGVTFVMMLVMTCMILGYVWSCYSKRAKKDISSQ